MKLTFNFREGGLPASLSAETLVEGEASAKAGASRRPNLFRSIFLILNFSFLISDLSARAQIQEAWVAKYNNGITNGNHQALKLALDSTGNIYVCGFSQDAVSNLDYVTIKYTPNGRQAWASRYASTNIAQSKPAAFALDPSNNAIVTGNSGTIKYDSHGSQLWTAPYAGLSVASDTNANVIITGFGTSFNTVKLTPGGSNIWLQTYVDIGPTIAQVVIADPAGNIYVSGSDNFYCDRAGCYVELTTISYDANGMLRWKVSGAPSPVTTVNARDMVQDPQDNLYVLADFPDVSPYTIVKYSTNGALLWSLSNPTHAFFALSRGLVMANGSVVVTGETPLPGSTGTSFGTYEIDTGGNYVWTNYYPTSPRAQVAGMPFLLTRQATRMSPATRPTPTEPMTS
jgi:hypothetical protein